jgi:hypothetical protein
MTGVRRGGPKCLARRKRSEQLCMLPAGWGTSHPGSGRCKLHAGSTPSHRAAAVTTAAAAELDRLGEAPVSNPLYELARIAGRARAWEELLSRQVAELAALTCDTAEGAAQLHALLPLWERSLDRTAAFLNMLARLDIDERIARVEAAAHHVVADRFHRAVTEVFTTCGFAHDSDAVMAVVVEVLARQDAAIVEYRPPGLRWALNGDGR